MKIWQAATLAAMMAAAVPAGAVELVSNGGFETGDLTAWKDFANGQSVVGTQAHSGNYGYRYTGTGGATSDFIYQFVTTVPGQSYDWSFWLATNLTGTNTVVFALGQNVLLTYIKDLGTQGFTRYSGTAIADVTQSSLQFQLRSGSGTYTIDDVSLTPSAVPEPAVWAMLVAGLGAAGLAQRRRRLAA